MLYGNFLWTCIIHHCERQGEIKSLQSKTTDGWGARTPENAEHSMSDVWFLFTRVEVLRYTFGAALCITAQAKWHSFQEPIGRRQGKTIGFRRNLSERQGQRQEKKKGDTIEGSLGASHRPPADPPKNKKHNGINGIGRHNIPTMQGTERTRKKQAQGATDKSAEIANIPAQPYAQSRAASDRHA